MFNTDFRRTALSVLGALILTTTAVSAAVGPARAIETAPVALAASGTANAATANG